MVTEMFGIKIKGDLFLTYGKFESGKKALKFGEAEFGELCDWEIVRVNS